MVNDSRKLLKNVKILEEIAPSPSLKVKKFIYAFKAFNDVVLSCYGRVLSPNYKDQINVFTKISKYLLHLKFMQFYFTSLNFVIRKGWGFPLGVSKPLNLYIMISNKNGKTSTYEKLTIQFTENNFSKLSYRITVSTCKQLLYLFVKSLVI